MKAGISTSVLNGRMETEDALGTAARLGADACEVCLQTFYEYRPEFSKKYAPRIGGTETVSVRFNPQSFGQQLFSPSRRVRGDGFYWLDQVLRSAQLLGAQNLTFHGAAGGDAEYLNGVISFCARYGANLALENSLFGLYNGPYVFGELKNRCPQLCGVLNLKQALRSGYPYAMYIEDMRGSISRVCITDFDADGKARLPGFGIFDFEEILKRLKGAGFDGALLIDDCDYGDISELEKSISFLKEKLYKIR